MLANAMEMKTNPYRQDESDRVLVVLDVRNVTARQNQEYCNTEIDYVKLLSDLVGIRKCIAAVAVDSLILDENGKDSARVFHSSLKNSGFRLDLIPPSNNQGKQEGVDVEISSLITAFGARGQCDSVELITGDGDFAPLLKRLHEFGITVGITSFRKSLSYHLYDEADSINCIDTMPVIRMNPAAATGDDC